MTVLQSFDARTGQPIDAPAGHPLIATSCPAYSPAACRRSASFPIEPSGRGPTTPTGPTYPSTLRRLFSLSIAT